jgi:hypothetical protein
MKRVLTILFVTTLFMLLHQFVWAQCSICAKTASQMGEDAARGLNGGIIYLAAAPFMILGYIGYRWWRNNRD